MADDVGTGLQVELVAADRTVWSGEASMVIARTTEGDLGVLPGHAPLLSLLTEAAVEISAVEGVVHAAVDGGFLSVAGDRVSILTQHALLAEEIKIDEAHAALEAAEGMPTGDERELHLRRAQARIRAAEKAG
ncbi:ATP synthase epsilon chain [Nocardioides sp. OK12]|uniref:ATP synthase epsilon chain n=1 Tax=Nocardioides marinisabuli TaxID=419476 RepID=A0A7Y9F595_9ACTN|nr:MULTISPECIES: F0F1 ATP synthase subunit epsilon [Nocardioides]NYD59641.1 F-type H+-transporting ATPase subunit epsilon [Nocardioides marinisabuli]GHJ59934.1 ATP synthase epsilon chain [Nocardioides sp. OK12]